MEEEWVKRATWHFGHYLFSRLNILMESCDRAGIYARYNPSEDTTRSYYSVVAQLWVNVFPVADKSTRKAVEAKFTQVKEKIEKQDYPGAVEDLSDLHALALQVLQARGLLYQIGLFASPEKALEQWGVEIFAGEKERED